MAKTGPISAAELQSLWQSVTDSGYWNPLVEAGDGNGFEVHSQSFAQFARVSQAVDTTTQGLYLLPWSGQTDEPASGAAYSTVQLVLVRDSNTQVTAYSGGGFLNTYEITLVEGTVVEEIQVDFSPSGGVPFSTGRRYALIETVGFGPGDLGPITASARAVAAGRGYDNPMPGTLTSFFQPGSSFGGLGASIVPGTTGHSLIASLSADAPIPEMVGQYVYLFDTALSESSPNTGQIRRVKAYLPASSDNGGTLLLAPTVVARFNVGGTPGTFASGETITSDTGAIGTFVFQSKTHIVFDRVSGSFAAGDIYTGSISAATCTVDSIDQSPDLVAAGAVIEWRVFDWAADFSVSGTNPQSPAGGRLAVLDQIGAERQVFRSSGQTDDQYRRSIATLADTVSPNAISRCVNRVLGPFGYQGWLREVGSSQLPGLFFDGDPADTNPAVAYAYDLDFTTRPEDRYKLLLDYVDFRAFFLVGVPPLGLGEFGAMFDATTSGLTNFFDCAPYSAFFDGYPLTAATLYQSVWSAVNAARAGGVGFELVQDKNGAL